MTALMLAAVAGGAPLVEFLPGRGADADLETRRMGRLISRAVRHFNGDFRGYYFGIGTLALFIHP